MKKVVRLTESDLHRVIKESVKQVLKESVSLKDMIFVAYGTDAYNSDLFKPYNNKRTLNFGMNKPIGGLWASPLNSRYGWGKWCDDNDFNVDSLNQHFLFKLSTNAKIYIIDSKEDIIKISNVSDYFGISKNMNFQQLIDEGYDGIFVTDNAISNYRMHVAKGYGDLNVWDLSSICIFNKDVIEPIDETPFEREMVPRYEEDYDMSDEWDYYSRNDDTKKNRQMSSDFGKYSNQNIHNDMSKFFKGKHPAILAQGYDNDKETELSRRFNGTIKSGLD